MKKDGHARPFSLRLTIVRSGVAGVPATRVPRQIE